MVLGNRVSKTPKKAILREKTRFQSYNGTFGKKHCKAPRQVKRGDQRGVVTLSDSKSHRTNRKRTNKGQRRRQRTGGDGY